MQISKNKNQRRRTAPWVLPVVVAVIIIALYLLSASVFSIWPFARSSPSGSSNNQSQTPSKQDSADGSVAQDTGNKKPTQNDEPQSSESTSTISGVINHQSVENGILRLRVTIDQALSTGTCELTLTHTSSQKQVKKSASVTPNPSSATCQGFDIPIAELGAGTWTIEIAISDDDMSGKLTGSVSI